MQLDWNDIPLLLAVEEGRSMSVAARQVGVDVSTVSRRVVAAEAALGVRLFVREPGGYRCTGAGRVFFSHARTLSQNVQDMLLDTQAEAEGMEGPVRLTAIDVLLTHWLCGYLPNLLRDQPGLQMQLIASNSDLSFARGEADLAIRLARPTSDASLRMKKVGQLAFGVYGARSFANLHPADWHFQPWLAYGDELSRLPEMKWIRSVGVKIALRTSSVSTLEGACQAGVGLALLPCFVGEGSGLMRLDPKPVLLRDMWLLSHRNAGKVRRFQYVSSWLVELFSKCALSLRGGDNARS
jgi:DNA-binding transcriptional LysR family regulator